MQPAGSVERVHFDNFALISHTRDSPCGAGLTLPGVPETNPRALRLPVASIKPVSKISPAIPRPGEKQTPRRDVQNMLIHTHTHTHAHMRTHTRAPRMLAKASSVVSWRRKSFCVFFFLFSHEISLFPSVPFPLPFPVILRGHTERAVDYPDLHAGGNVSIYNYAKAANYRCIN